MKVYGQSQHQGIRDAAQLDKKVAQHLAEKGFHPVAIRYALKQNASVHKLGHNEVKSERKGAQSQAQDMCLLVQQYHDRE